MLSFKWFGQACFEISNSKTIVTDPHDGDSVGLSAPKTTADVVTISHDHYDHASGKDLVSNNNTVIVNETGKTNIDELNVTGFKSFHDKSHGQARGENIIFNIETKGYTICHLGDLGHMLNHKSIQNIKPVDVLLIPVGGKFTIDGREAAKLVKKIDPVVVVPMHYKINGLEVPISGPKTFINNVKDEYRIQKVDVLSFNQLTDDKTVYVLECQA